MNKFNKKLFIVYEITNFFKNKEKIYNDIVRNILHSDMNCGILFCRSNKGMKIVI